LYGTKSVKEHIAIRKLKLKEIKKLNNKDIISIDECSINRETHAKYGYCKKTKRLIRYVKRNNLLVNHSLIMAINQNKVMQYELLKKSVNTDSFYTFLEKLLVNKKTNIF
jgi:hypothetical protein